MSRLRVHLSQHALLESIPLRLGRVLESPKIFLENIFEDEQGTSSQRFSDRDRGRKHFVADLWTERLGGEHLSKWRLVVAPSTQHDLDQIVITVLPTDGSILRTTQNLSDHLSNERKKANRDWLTPKYISEVLHPLVVCGEMTDQSHLTDHILQVEKKPLLDLARRLSHENQHVPAVAEEAISHVTSLEDQLAQAKESERSALTKLGVALMALSQTQKPSSTDDFAAMPLPAKKVTEPWSSKTGSAYLNLGVEASIVSVNRKENQVRLTYIDVHGKSRTVEDFGFRGFVEPVFAYLKSREGTRAVFLLTYLPDKPLRLAADTMMLPQYRNLWT